MNMKVMIKCIFVIKSCILYFISFSSFCIFVILFLLSSTRQFFELSIYGVYNKQLVGAGINTLMSISDELGPSIFCRKTEKERPMMKEMDGKAVYFPSESAFFKFDVLYLKVFFPICTLTWRVNNYVSRQEKV